MKWSALALSLLPLSAYAGMYGQPVVNLDAKTFKQVMAAEHAAMVAFVAPWCGHCKSLGPDFTAAAQSLSPLIPFYAVDCDDSKNKGLCAEYGIQGFPTIKAFPRASKGAARDYNGERKRGGLVDYAKGLVPDRVKKLRLEGGPEATLQKFLDEKPQLPHALLIHPSTPSIPFLWKVLGHRLSSKLHLGYIKDSASHEVISALGIHDPSDSTRDNTRAVVWQPGAHRSELIEYEGALKFNALLEWLQAHVDGTAPPPSSSDKKPAQKPVKAPSAESTESSGSKSSAAEEKARRQAKLDEAEKRDRARREKAARAAQAAGGLKVDDAPEAVPEEHVGDVPVSYAHSGGAADPVPELEVEAEGAGVAEATETIVHEEL